MANNVAVGGGVRKFQGVQDIVNRRIGSDNNGIGIDRNNGAVAPASGCDQELRQQSKNLPNTMPIPTPAQTQTQAATQICMLMYEREWDGVYDALFDERTGEPLPSSKVLHFESNCGETLLHVMCRYQPPLEMVELVVETWPFLTSKVVASRQQTALHLACEFGSRSDIVKYLLQKFGEATMMPDVNGRVPLHLACRPQKCPSPDVYNKVSSNDCNAEEMEPYYIQPGSAVIKALCAHSPKAVNVEDSEDCNPIEIAIAARDHDKHHIPVSRTVCQILLDTSKTAWELDREECSEELLERQDEKFSLPGYSAAAARVLLVRCRSNCSLRSIDGTGGSSISLARGSEPASLNGQNMSSGAQGNNANSVWGSIEAAPVSLQRNQFLDCNALPKSRSTSDMLSFTLPPYQDMLQRYRKQSPNTSPSYIGTGGSTSKGPLARGTVRMRRSSTVREGVPSLGPKSQSTSAIGYDWGLNEKLPPIKSTNTGESYTSNAPDGCEKATKAPPPAISLLSYAMKDYDHPEQQET
jgi:hypothetical protein